MEADFSGYATKAGLKCSDGRTIMPNAFKNMDGMKVPLVWQHGHSDSDNVLGHAVLENREDGVYAQAFFNGTEKAKNAKLLVQHGDITALSIYANQLVEKSKSVLHGVIRELSLVLSGANPGALIDYVSIAHSNGDVDVLDDEAIIYTGLSLEHSDDEDDEDDEEDDDKKNKAGDEDDEDDEDDSVEHADDDTLKDIYNTFSAEQKNVVAYMIGAALEGSEGKSAEHKDGDENTLNHQEGTNMTHNVFEKSGGSAEETLSHDAIKSIVADAVKGGSLKDAVDNYALSHGIENIEVMFPDAKALSDRPEFDSRRMEWVADVLRGTKHTPFSRIKSLVADLTHEAARAKGYIKGSMKKEEFFGVSKRVTTPTTIYKKQKLDRDDIIDITDFDVVAWLKAEMRMMLDEELARAILIGDGREVSDEDKIKDPQGSTEGAGIRSIANDHELYVTTINVNMDDDASTPGEIIDAILLNRKFYKGSGTPKFYTTETVLTQLLMSKDTLGRRLYPNLGDLASELRVSEIVPVEVMEDETDLVGIIVNLSDYAIGADKGGDVSLFDDFDIDYNQYKYLIETRLSGALTKIKSALVIKKVAGTDVLATPTAPSFDQASNTITIPTVTGVVYQIDGVTKAAGDVVITEDTMVDAVPASGYYFENDAEDSWLFTFVA